MLTSCSTVINVCLCYWSSYWLTRWQLFPYFLLLGDCLGGCFVTLRDSCIPKEQRSWSRAVGEGKHEETVCVVTRALQQLLTKRSTKVSQHPPLFISALLGRKVSTNWRMWKNVAWGTHSIFSSAAFSAMWGQLWDILLENISLNLCMLWLGFKLDHDLLIESFLGLNHCFKAACQYILFKIGREEKYTLSSETLYALFYTERLRQYVPWERSQGRQTCG